MFLRRVLEECGHEQLMPTPLYEDNQSCRMMSENPISNERSKHIDYRVHALRERVKDGVVRLIDCASGDMLADVLTKNLPAPDFARHRQVMAGLEDHTSPDLPDDLTVAGPRVTPPRQLTQYFASPRTSIKDDWSCDQLLQVSGFSRKLVHWGYTHKCV